MLKGPRGMCSVILSFTYIAETSALYRESSRPVPENPNSSPVPWLTSSAPVAFHTSYLYTHRRIAQRPWLSREKCPQDTRARRQYRLLPLVGSRPTRSPPTIYTVCRGRSVRTPCPHRYNLSNLDDELELDVGRSWPRRTPSSFERS